MLPPNLGPALIETVVFGVAGVLLAAFAFKFFDWITPKLHVETELAEKQNLAVAIVAGAVILGAFHLVATVCRIL